MSTQPHGPAGQAGTWFQAALLAVITFSAAAIFAAIAILMIVL